LLTLQSQLVKAKTDRDAAQRSLDALRRLQQKGAASIGEVKEAENNLQRSQADLDLLEQKQKERYSKPEVDKVDAQKSQAQAAYDAAEDTLHKSNVVAPFEEADLSHLIVRAYVDEPDIGRLVKGQKTEITWDAVPGRIWTGTVATLPATVKLRGTRNVGEATIDLDNEDYKLLPNTNVSVGIIVAQHDNVLTIPREALRQDESGPFVYQITNNKLRRHPVGVAASNLTKVEVSSGLSDKDLVALNSTSNLKSLRDGSPVKVVQ
jgi:HlyD family secretion protein